MEHLTTLLQELGKSLAQDVYKYPKETNLSRSNINDVGELVTDSGITHQSMYKYNIKFILGTHFYLDSQMVDNTRDDESELKEAFRYIFKSLAREVYGEITDDLLNLLRFVYKNSYNLTSYSQDIIMELKRIISKMEPH